MEGVEDISANIAYKQASDFVRSCHNNDYFFYKVDMQYPSHQSCAIVSDELNESGTSKTYRKILTAILFRRD